MENKWDIEIKPKKKLLDVDIKGIWKYRDLYRMYVKRDIVTVYKQTILGPLWFLIQPIFTTIMYMFVFGGLAGISTDGAPQPLFYMSGILLWNYFNSAFMVSSNVFTTNASIGSTFIRYNIQFDKVWNSVSSVYSYVSLLLGSGSRFAYKLDVDTFSLSCFSNSFSCHVLGIDYIGSDYKISRFDSIGYIWHSVVYVCYPCNLSFKCGSGKVSRFDILESVDSHI